MKCRVASVNACLGLLIAPVFVVTLSSSTFAQGRPGPPPGAGPPGDNNPIRADRSRQMDESRLRRAEIAVNEEGEQQKRVEAAIVDMKENFTRIQVLRNDIARNLVARKPIDYKLVSAQTAEINKRAHRLKVYMSARATENKEQNSAPDLKSEEMIEALVKLCKLIDSFTENPALKDAATVDAKEIDKAKEAKAKADGDLLAIIKLSESIEKKSASLKAPR
jgi:hypothetical protein